QGFDDGDGRGLARLLAGIPADAAPVVAQHRLAEAPCLVRGRSGALPARPRGRYAHCMKRLAALVVLLALAACAPTVQHAGAPGAGFEGPRLEDHTVVSFDGTRLGLTRWDAEGEPWAVIVGVHGMDDYANAF